MHHKRHHKMDDQCSQRHPCSANRLAPSTPQRNLDQHSTILHLRWASSESADTSVTRVTVATMLLRADHPVGLKCYIAELLSCAWRQKRSWKRSKIFPKKKNFISTNILPFKDSYRVTVSGASPPPVSPGTAAAACANFCLMGFVRSEST